MCGGNTWEHARWRPFADFVRDLKPSQRAPR
jgi:hypothetical protein